MRFFLYVTVLAALSNVSALVPTLFSAPKTKAKIKPAAFSPVIKDSPKSELKPIFSAVATSLIPLMSLAEEDYEYGAVSAPGWVLPLGAFFAIATALLPLALRAGDDAQREMAERDVDSFGKGVSPLDKKKR